MLPVLGRADDMRAEVWIACDPAAAGIEPHGDEPLRMAGRLAGPTCTLAATLPMTATIVDQGAVAGRRPLGRVTCTEPGFWTPDVPCLYRASVELVRGGRTVASGERTLGLRRTGVRDGSIRLDGKRYVPRGVGFTGGGEEIASLRTLHAAAVVDEDHLTADLSASADRRGVVIVARARSGRGGSAAGAPAGRPPRRGLSPNHAGAAAAAAPVAGGGGRVARGASSRPGWCRRTSNPMPIFRWS